MLEHHADLRAPAVAPDRPGHHPHPEDEAEVRALLTSLRDLRVLDGLTQREVAIRMGVRQPTVAGYGAGGTSLRVRTLQRYARACGARLRMRLELLDLADGPDVNRDAP